MTGKTIKCPCCGMELSKKDINIEVTGTAEISFSSCLPKISPYGVLDLDLSTVEEEMKENIEWMALCPACALELSDDLLLQLLKEE